MTLSNVHLYGRPGLWNIVTSDGVIAAIDPAAGPDANLLVMPAFIDAHCHITITGMDLHSLSLAGASCHDEALSRIEERSKSLAPGEWLLAVDYNQNLFDEKAHLGRSQIDAVCAEHPVLVRHVSWHAAVANSKALEMANVGADFRNPSGGEFIRDSNGHLTGVLLEDAYKIVGKAVPDPTADSLASALVEAGFAMKKVGVGTATDMFIGRYGLALELEAFRLAYERGMPIRSRLALDWHQVVGKKALDPGLLSELTGALDPAWCKVWGLKLFEDGAIGSGTAAIHGAYATGGGNGILMYSPDRLNEMLVTAHDAGWRVSVHSIGDRSTDAVLDAFEATGEPGRHRLEHAMICSDAQIERIAKAGCHVTMQPEFLARMGTTYQTQLGPEVAFRLKRARSFLDAGISLSFNSDRPIVSGDPWVGIGAATNRPAGYDPAENVTLDEAIRAYTVMGAVANDDAGSHGEVAVGQWADLLVLEGVGLRAGRPLVILECMPNGTKTSRG